jgi:membrane protease YdiL (CAAX protease family)
MSVMTAMAPVRTWVFLTVCAAAGGLAVPLHAIATPAVAVVSGLVGFLGLRVWRWSGLPDVLKPDTSHGVDRLMQPAVSIGIGLILGLLLLGVIRLAIEPTFPPVGVRLAAAAAEPAWRRVLIIYVAAVGEELVFRLLLLSFIAGVTVRLFRRSDRLPNRDTAWVAIGLSALIFGAAHLPAWSAAAPLGLGLAVGVVLLNAVGGVLFGYVFVKRGIGAAMLAHAGADCVIQLIGPLTG